MATAVCPKCGSFDFVRSRVASIFERLYKRFTRRRPHRCGKCGRRAWLKPAEVSQHSPPQTMGGSAAFARQADRAQLMNELDAAYPSGLEDAPAMQADTPAAETDTRDVETHATPAQADITDEAATTAPDPDATAIPRRS